MRPFLFSKRRVSNGKLFRKNLSFNSYSRPSGKPTIRAILHPKEEPNVTYCVKSDDIEIRLSQGKSLTDKDIMIIKKLRKGEKNPTEQKDMLSTSRKKKQYTNKETVSNSTTVDFSRFKKELFLFLYIQRNTML